MSKLKSVLLVDDDPLVLNGILRNMRKQPFAITAVTSASEAMNIMNSNTFDVIVTDNWMKGKNGVELLTWVEENFPNTARIVLTGHPGLLALEQLPVKAYTVLAKPVDATLLCNAIVEAFESRNIEDVDLREAIAMVQSENTFEK